MNGVPLETLLRLISGQVHEPGEGVRSFARGQGMTLFAKAQKNVAEAATFCLT